MTSTTTRRGRGSRPVALIARVSALAAFAATAALGVGLAPPATAATSSAATAADEAMSPVMIVLDASGSMNQTDAPGPRIDAAKAAVRDLVTGLPANAEVGLTVYGTHTGSSNAEKAAGCQDITQLAPVGRVDKTALTNAVDSIVAKGYTPIGTALQKAAAALPAEGPRAIVLVSDGEDTCSPPPPCDVAAQLKAQGVDLVVHTVGFKVDDAARQQLSCIAQATGGTYSDAQDAGSLNTSLSVQVDRALQPYDVQGTKVKGTSAPSGAPQLVPGQYQDTLVNAGDEIASSGGPGNYYTVDLQEGETPYLTATIVPKVENTHRSVNNLIVTAVLTPARAGTGTCSFELDNLSQTFQQKLRTTTVVLTPGEVGGPNWPSDCPTSGTFLLNVTRNFGGEAPMPLEIAYRSEPAADVTGVPAGATRGPTPALPTPSADVVALAGGASFNSAPEVTSGQTVSDTIVFGEDRYFKVHLDWGQQLSFRFDTGVVDGLTLFDGVQTSAWAYNPVREELGDITVSPYTGFQSLGYKPGQVSGGSSAPARWTNRQEFDPWVRSYALDGDYYVSYTAGYSNSGVTATVPYTLTVAVTGAKEQGPQYSQRVGPSSSSTGGSNGAAGNGSAGNGAASNGAAGNRSTPQSDSQDTGWSAGRTTLVGGSIGLAVLAAIVLGWLLLGRRRTRRPATAAVTPSPGGSDPS